MQAILQILKCGYVFHEPMELVVAQYFCALDIYLHFLFFVCSPSVNVLLQICSLSSYYIQGGNVNLNFFASIGYALSSCRKTLSDKFLPVYITLNTTSLMISKSPKGLGSVFENVEHWLNMFI